MCLHFCFCFFHQYFYASNGKVVKIIWTVELIKEILLQKTSYFPESNNHRKSKIKGDLNLYNYATKCGLKNTKGVDTSNSTEKTDLANLKSDFYELNTDNC